MKTTAAKTPKLKIRKGDTVKVLTGNDRGKTGKVLEILTKENKVLVEGINQKTKHLKPSATNPNGSITQLEAPIHISNLMLVDPATGEATKVGRKADANGKLQRYSKKTGDIINNG